MKSFRRLLWLPKSVKIGAGVASPLEGPLKPALAPSYGHARERVCAGRADAGTWINMRLVDKSVHGCDHTRETPRIPSLTGSVHSPGRITIRALQLFVPPNFRELCLAECRINRIRSRRVLGARLDGAAA